MNSIAFDAQTPACRLALKAMSKAGNRTEFTELLRFSVTSIEYEQDPRGFILTFVMSRAAKCDEMRQVLYHVIKPLKKLHSEQLDMVLFSIRATSR